MAAAVEGSSPARSWIGSSFPVVTAGATLLLLWLSAILPTWEDEEWTLHTTAHGVVYAFHQAIVFEEQAPLYFVVMGAWRTLDPGSVFLARAFSVLCTVVTLVLAAQIARRIWPGGPTRVFTALVPLHPFVVFAATAIRLYALGVALTAALYLTWYDGFFDEHAPNKRVSRVAFVLQHLVYYAAVVALVALLLAGRPQRDKTLIAVWLTAMTIALLYVLLVVVTKVTLIIPRHALTLVVPIAVAMYATVARFRASRAAAIACAVALLFAVSSAASLAYSFRDFSKSGDVAHVAAYLGSHVAPGDTIGVFGAEEEPPLRRYLDPRLTLIAIPHAPTFRHFTFDEFKLRSEADVERRIGTSVLGRRTLWLTRDGICEDPTYGCRFLDDVLAREYRPVERAEFHNNSVTKYIPN